VVDKNLEKGRTLAAQCFNRFKSHVVNHQYECFLWYIFQHSWSRNKQRRFVHFDAHCRVPHAEMTFEIFSKGLPCIHAEYLSWASMRVGMSVNHELNSV
jgi:hypothetical protein